MQPGNIQGNVDVVREYFLRADTGGDVCDLFTADCQVYYPKFGVARGRAGLVEFATGLMAVVTRIQHPLDTMEFIVQGDRVAAEGLFSGELQDKTTWAPGITPTGRFCSIFELREGLISRMHIYVDPDYGSYNERGFLWGRNRTW